ncbi:hypothetical protein AgCh_040067 [Apium graveolens]
MVKGQGTTTIKKNMRTILIQEYEHFDSRDIESLIEIYDRFQKLLNDLSLVNKEYDLEDSNLKFLLALPEKWDFKVTSIRDNYQLDKTPLDEIYGVLKTHELEMEQRSKRKGSKSRHVALKVEEKPNEKSRRKSYSKGKTMIAKSDTESSNSDDDSNTDNKLDTDSDHNNNEDMDQLAALLIKSFKKMVYKNFKKGRSFSRKGSSSSNSDKRNNRRNTDWKESRYGKPDKSKETYKELAKEREVIKFWTNSGKSTQEILENGCLGSGLGYSARSNSDKKSGKETEKIEPIRTDSKVKLNKVQINTIKFNPGVNNVKSIHEEGTTSTPRSNFITDKSEQVHTKSVNNGSMTQKQLKQKLKDLYMKDKRKRSRKNRNGKDSSVSQICDIGYHVNFYEEHCEIISKSDGKIAMTGASHALWITILYIGALTVASTKWYIHTYCVMLAARDWLLVPHIQQRIWGMRIVSGLLLISFFLEIVSSSGGKVATYCKNHSQS